MSNNDLSITFLDDKIKKSTGDVMKKRQLLIVLTASTVLVVIAILLVLLTAESEPTNYSYRIVNTYPHDETAFTQGLLFDSGVLYEGTGLYGNSSLRRVELATGEILQLYAKPHCQIAVLE